jgi:ethanolamine utilization protein EutP (predicted NTPase)
MEQDNKQFEATLYLKHKLGYKKISNTLKTVYIIKYYKNLNNRIEMIFFNEYVNFQKSHAIYYGVVNSYE